MEDYSCEAHVLADRLRLDIALAQRLLDRPGDLHPVCVSTRYCLCPGYRKGCGRAWEREVLRSAGLEVRAHFHGTEFRGRLARPVIEELSRYDWVRCVIGTREG